MSRLDPQPGEVIDRRLDLRFQFDGKTFQAHPGDTIGSALAASGTDIFSRSFKYHRPRGLLCVSGKCPNCLMNVNGVPNVRVCAEPVRQGDRITSQHRWPSLRWDLFSVIEKFDRFLPVGFYYKTLFKPRFAWRMAEPLIRRLAGLGVLEIRKEEISHCQQEHLHTEIVVVGGGPAGLSAASAAAETGAEVLLIDDQPELGGHLRFHQRPFPDPTSGEPRAAFEIARDLAHEVQGQALIRDGPSRRRFRWLRRKPHRRSYRESLYFRFGPLKSWWPAEVTSIPAFLRTTTYLALCWAQASFD